ncbi:MAG: DUF4261 domain-containing protein [Ancrocorticia sp.]|jgi:hypothetical protein|nr:DUF4261 domain-containing protein [Ancrocorticia sp.]MCI1933202.1 DUF4261 domain-containing protein [Ancrocorticia sp.]MCI1964320.1 DUF4261 domain-containing protein [Ancrocorticia sp.]MCI2002952.1 DUF4261 domain-containing protein [Ancrocorticia sp.]MCI2012633.1 DUF4261 domain-containing protein [Ancrocorticia sp.]
MSAELPVSAIHPQAPEFLSVAALYRAPIDVEAALARMKELWNEPVSPVWEEVPAGSPGTGTEAGRLLRFSIDGVLVMMTPISGSLEVQRGHLPDHTFYIAVTTYSPVREQDLAEAAHRTGRVNGVKPGDVPPADALPLARRRRMVSAHIVLTEVLDVLMREEAAVGVYRSELGVVQPPEMVTELADSLTRGQAPVPLWVSVRLVHPDLVYGRTLGLALFGHLDLEVVESMKSEEEVYAMLANTADYIVSSDFYLLPGQTVGYREGEELQITEATSPTDGTAVLRIQF